MRIRIQETAAVGLDTFNVHLTTRAVTTGKLSKNVYSYRKDDPELFNFLHLLGSAFFFHDLYNAQHADLMRTFDNLRRMLNINNSTLLIDRIINSQTTSPLYTVPAVVEVRGVSAEVIYDTELCYNSGTYKRLSISNTPYTHFVTD